MASDRTIFDEPHHQSLELLAARALADNNPMTAFRLADRRCRISPAPEPHSYILRAEAARRMGDKTNAISDIEKAIELAPDDIAANRKLLAWGGRAQRTRAAQALIANDRDPGMLRKAVKALFDDGRMAFAKLSVLDNAIEGWAAWQGRGAFEIAIAGGANNMTATFDPDPFHPLAGDGAAVSFSLARPMSASPQTIVLSGPHGAFHSLRTAANDRGVFSPRRFASAAVAHEAPATVIVPIYADYESTRACLDSLLAEMRTAPRHRALLVNDATPDRRIADHLATLAGAERVKVLTNSHNLGFIGSINRALAHAPDGDVILLNADTIVPSGFIDRLSAAAHSSVDIGTVTPFSNNGEFTSFPLANIANDLQTPAEIERIGRIAASANDGIVVDIPSGIGFCLYVTSACLDAIGPLSEDYHRGYLEDVDFCLRARERGFRNVCAASTYVGHAGTKSFGSEKRSLVVRNLETLERRFPTHRGECAAFTLADPLRTARERIERAAAPPRRRPRLLVTREGALSEIARARAIRLAARGRRAIILEMRRGASGANARLFDPAGGLPQSVQFALASADERSAMHAYLCKLRPSGIEFLDAARVPAVLADMLFDLNIPHDMVIADAGLHDCRYGFFDGKPIPRRIAIGKRDDGQDQNFLGKDSHSIAVWRTIATKARRILAPCNGARAFASRILPNRTIILDKTPNRTRAPRRRRAARVRNLGIVPIRSDVQEQRLLGSIARAFTSARPEVFITVIGATLDDFNLMQFGNISVAGKVDENEFARVIEAYRLDALFVSAARPLFGHPAMSLAASSALPVSFLDWTMGEIKPRQGDLAIDPRSDLDAIVGALAKWIGH
ncbi:glycosyltransferase [Methylocapsa sp. S129]|uniref:glycosyltransferase n=1 Tax=Methylocapsa sp. S129 TaxID=1641869 RepID=UPI00131C24A9|nr:glycosyltransferase [Methylocapsa sp. S129]